MFRATTLHLVEAGVSQGSTLGPILYLLLTYDLPTLSGVLIGTFANDTAILSTAHNPHIASAKLQRSLNGIPIKHGLKHDLYALMKLKT